MAFPALSGESAASGSATSTSVSVRAPAGRSAGRLLVASLYLFSSSATPSTPRGWTLADPTPTVWRSIQQRTWLRIADGTATDDFASSWTGSLYRELDMFTVVGHDPARPVNASSADGGATSATPTLPTLTTTVDDCLLLGWVGPNDGTAFTAPSGFTAVPITGGGDGNYGLYDEQPTAGVSGDKRGSFTGSISWAAHMIAIAPTPVSGSSDGCALLGVG